MSETLYVDTKRWVFFEGEEDEVIGVYSRCQCGRFLKQGRLFINGFGEVMLREWICSRCGEVQPYFDRDCAN